MEKIYLILDSKLVQEQNLKLQNFEKKVFFISLNGKMFQGAARTIKVFSYNNNNNKNNSVTPLDIGFKISYRTIKIKVK